MECTPDIVPVSIQSTRSANISDENYGTAKELSIHNMTDGDSANMTEYDSYGSYDPPVNPHESIENILSQRITIVICVVGLIGNILNLIVLTRNGLQKTMQRLEKNSHIGLVALSVSDFLFCLAVMPQVMDFREKFPYEKIDFMLLYHVYFNAILNTFIMSSTWLTVTMAMQRFLAICHPIRARQTININFSKWSIVIVFILCILLNLPRFWTEQINTVHCLEGYNVYFVSPGPMRESRILELTYLWIYFIIAIVIPLILLTYCNVNLIRALRRSANLRRTCSNEAYCSSRDSETTHRITLTLIVIIAMYTTLVTPAELVNFIKDISEIQGVSFFQYNLIGAIANTAQAINFAFNFILYCIVNTHFRQTLRDVIYYPFSSIDSTCVNRPSFRPRSTTNNSLKATMITEKTDLV